MHGDALVIDFRHPASSAERASERIAMDAETADVVRDALHERMTKGDLAAARVEGQDDATTSFREASTPQTELTATLRDGASPFVERVRVAEILATLAPSELERLAEETADPELQKMLVPLAGRTKR